MTIDLPPELAAALTERAAHSHLTAEQFVVRYLTRLLTPFDPYAEEGNWLIPPESVAVGGDRRPGP